MAKMILPAPTERSATAVPGVSDVNDQNVYSALVVQNTGTGQQIVFTVPKGQAIPTMNGTSTATTQAHQRLYSDLTTNLTQAGQFGAALGDGSIRTIGITVEQAAYNTSGVTAGAQRSYGATEFEMADIASKCSFELKVGGKRQIIGPAFTYPNLGAVQGALSTTGNASTAAIANMGGAPRRLKVPIPVQRTDVLEGVFAVATGASLAFSTAPGDVSGQGQPCLVWFILHTSLASDAR